MGKKPLGPQLVEAKEQILRLSTELDQTTRDFRKKEKQVELQAEELRLKDEKIEALEQFKEGITDVENRIKELEIENRLLREDRERLWSLMKEGK